MSIPNKLQAALPLTPEQREWLNRVSPPVESAPKPGKPEKVIPPPVFTDAEITWLWPRFQKCRHQVYSFANSFAKTPLDRLTPKGKAILHEVAFPYRRQIFKDSAKWVQSQFNQAVREAAAKEPKTP